VSVINQAELEPPEVTKNENFILRHAKHHQRSITLVVSACIFTILSCIHYLLTMLSISSPGLALDDSWIHVQFARTIYEGMPWEYSPGYPSTGSTSPLWSIILSSVFWFTRDPIGVVWGVYIISIVFYVLSTFLAGHIVASYLDSVVAGVATCAAFVLVPRNTWLMLSGMETPVFVFILLLSIAMLDNEEAKYDLILGIVAGLAFLSRPEGAIIVLLIAARFLILSFKRKMTMKRIGMFFLSGLLAFAIVSPWILYCLTVTGYPLPDTFYAKVHVPTATEIDAWDIFWTYFIREMPFLPIAAFLGIILIPKGRPYAWLLPVILTVLYRLSAPYASLINNNRYLLPVFDLFLIPAIAALVIILRLIFVALLEFRYSVSLRHMTLAIAFILVIVPNVPSYTSQAPFYGKAVGNINDMQVTIGRWLYENTPPDAVFATHDAGALRYFSNRTMIDFAGLVSPDIVHGNLTDLEKIQYLHDHGCDYIVFFPDLFQYFFHLFPYDSIEIEYTVHLDDNVISGRDTMSVYHIDWERTSFS
jgi:hypothetical protein